MAAAVSLLAALVLCFPPWRSRNSLLLAGALVISASLEFFHLQTYLFPGDLSFWERGSLLSEGLLPSTWIVLTLGMCGFPSAGPRRLFSLVLLALSSLFLLAILFSSPQQMYFNPDFSKESVLFLGTLGYYFYLALVLFLTYPLVLLESFYSSLGQQARWVMKFELVGIGTIIATQLFYYSQGLLYRSLDYSFLPVRSFGLFLGAGLILYSLRRKKKIPQMALSRRVAYRSVVILVVGIYFLALGLAGEGMRYLGPYSQRYFLAMLALIGGLILIVLILSETMRRRMKVFISKNFYRDKYDYRDHWLGFTQRLSQKGLDGQIEDEILAFFCETFSVHGALLYLRSNESDDFLCVSGYGRSCPFENLPGQSELIGFLRERRWVLNAAEWELGNDQKVENFLSEQEIQFVIPLFVGEHLKGVIFLGTPINKGETFSFEDYDLMKVMAAQAMAVIHNQKLADQLSRNREMAAMGKVTAFVMHDLKNTVSNLALAVENGRHYLDNPEFQQDMLETLDKSVERMKGLVDRLKNLEGKKTLVLVEVDLLELAAGVVGDMSGRAIELTGAPVRCEVDPFEMARVVENLILNALDASNGEGPVELEVGQAGMAYLRCHDYGCGMSEAFIKERLFKPFETTKKKGFGIGLYQCRNIVEAHGGRIEVESQEGRGTTFTVWLPGCALAE
ncbi:PEP-CTERM system histidine kinase PrsK [Desulfuromonas sp. KJ2020]|uniref:XrtA/PEP-CTERM system histidine kinase PrsK n=1 Tax=Desulfuromonas sp. KJ2020 TaxID=2919173 RepID=UPI0020A774EC|nr:XrtA/PEP-CTERM system histidine kinase PrsK [Desulfuromonas sp. KJ2020]MCP3178125.1 PEP-CTERM system histidine kinase PrsK [Desulfuromonas sp. KJ2020]